MTAARPGATPLRGRYLVQNRGWNAFLRVSDALLAAIVRSNQSAPSTPPRRILLAVGGHLGDAVIASTVIPLLRDALPDIQLGVVLASWAAPALEGHPQLQWIHTVDHWKLNRLAEGPSAKLRRYRRSRRRALEEIRVVRYDAAVDLYPFYPNMAGLLWRAGIPRRVGYTSGGYGPLYSHRLDWSQDGRHSAEHHVALLNRLFPQIGDGSELRYDLPSVTTAVRENVAALLQANGLVPGEYVVIHMGTGAARKEWPRESWRSLARSLVADGSRLVFTGFGAREHDAIRAVADGLPGCVDLCGQLDWRSFSQLLAYAQLLIGVDTAAVHVAAAMGTPCVVATTGMSDPAQWRPLGERASVLVNAVPCLPCFQKHGCESMACIRGLGVHTVLEAARRHMRVTA